MAMKPLKSIINKKIKNPEFRVAFEEYEKEFLIAQKIVALRKKANLTQAELATLAKTSQSAIARLESGEHRNMTLEFLTKIGKALGVEPEINFKKIRHAKA